MTAVWILGRGGLLGSALRKKVQNLGHREYVPTDILPWEQPSDLASVLHKAIDEFSAFIKDDAWQIFIAAGKGTMASTNEDMEKETEMFRTLFACIGESEALTTSRGTIILASSAGAIYAGCNDDLITEASAPAPLNAYGRGKMEQEKLAQAFSENHASLRLLIARISNLYGSAQSKNKKQGLLTHIARSIIQRTPINIFVPFDTIRDYLHVDDAAQMLMQILDLQQGKERILTKIIASENPVSIAQIIGIFKGVTRISPRIMTSSSPLRDSYVHRMKFRSTVLPLAEKPATSLLIGVAQVMAAERLAMMRG